MSVRGVVSRRSLLSLFGALLALSFAVSNAASQVTFTLGTPGDSHDSGNCMPFGCWQSDDVTGFQQIFSASLFGQKVLDIFRIQYSRPPVYLPRDGNEWGTLLPGQWVIRFSTTTVSPETMSFDLPSNFGASSAVFFPNLYTMGRGFSTGFRTDTTRGLGTFSWTSRR